ncbi:MAG: hypothetical protein TREMPRED_003391, partial [Tremellales sp. Tagirdzhanova-0007]
LTITGLIILGIVITSGGGPDHHSIGFQFWRHPGPFTQYNDITGSKGRFLGFWAVLTQAAFSYIGTEIVAIAAGEARNPRRNIPRAIKKVYIRILLFYLGGTFIIGLLVPSTDPSLRLGSGVGKSPFVIAIRNAGIPALPSIINACLLTAASSAASSDLYTASRAIYGLALTRSAPQVFARTTARGLPYVAIGFTALFGALAYMSLSKGAGNVFNYLVDLSAASGLLTWLGIDILYIRFYAGLKAQGISRSSLPWTSRFNTGAAAAWYSAVWIVVILFFSGFNVFLDDSWDVGTFVTDYLPIWLFPVLWVGWKLVKRTHFMRADEMDFLSGLEEVEAASYDEPPPKNFVERVWRTIM